MSNSKSDAQGAESDEIDLRRLLAESFLADAEHHAQLDSTQDRRWPPRRRALKARC